jgi:hypothetical protein
MSFPARAATRIQNRSPVHENSPGSSPLRESHPDYAAGRHFSGLNVRSVVAGNFLSIAAGLIGRGAKLPPQFGQRPFNRVSTQSQQNVHSKVQIIASVALGGRSLSQHSQPGFTNSMCISEAMPRAPDPNRLSGPQCLPTRPTNAPRPVPHPRRPSARRPIADAWSRRDE